MANKLPLKKSPKPGPDVEVDLPEARAEEVKGGTDFASQLGRPVLRPLKVPLAVLSGDPNLPRNL